MIDKNTFNSHETFNNIEKSRCFSRGDFKCFFFFFFNYGRNRLREYSVIFDLFFFPSKLNIGGSKNGQKFTVLSYTRELSSREHSLYPENCIPTNHVYKSYKSMSTGHNAKCD